VRRQPAFLSPARDRHAKVVLLGAIVQSIPDPHRLESRNQFGEEAVENAPWMKKRVSEMQS
ncbi:MAG: hypothetical protein E6699_41160, partial [Bradyrhizobium sp.]|uniref:hypothetical protein n=1 Tax=Bradyrhizobium sp. TaxID=376 RepID=UPI0029001C59